MFCLAIEHREADVFWSGKTALSRLNGQYENTFQIGGNRLNLALSKMAQHWDFSGHQLSAIGRKCMSQLLPGAAALMTLNLSSMDIDGLIPPELGSCNALRT